MSRQTLAPYVLPLYVGTLREVAEARGGFYPADIYSQWTKYLVIPWIVGPVLRIP